MADVAPDGTVAYFGRDGEIWTMGLDGSAAASLGIETGGRSFSPRWSPDGSKLAVLRYDPRQHTTAHPEAGIDAGLALLDVVVIDPATGDVSDIGPRVATDYEAPSVDTGRDGPVGQPLPRRLSETGHIRRHRRPAVAGPAPWRVYSRPSSIPIISITLVGNAPQERPRPSRGCRPGPRPGPTAGPAGPTTRRPKSRGHFP